VYAVFLSALVRKLEFNTPMTTCWKLLSWP